MAETDYKRCRCEKRSGCERCGGSGWLKKCDHIDCVEYGCNGGRYCFVSLREGAQLDRSNLVSGEQGAANG